MKQIKIVFAGGPISGKTSTLRLLQKRLAPTAVTVDFLSEAATELLSGTGTDPHNDGFQQDVFELQTSLEEHSHASVMISDRGVADAFVYHCAERAEEICHASLTECLERYDAILFFEPYENAGSVGEGNAVRYERKEELAELNQRTRRIWQQHERFYEIPVFATVEEKTDCVAELLNRIIGEPVFLENLT